jgi:purine-cytosine permease-like protein
MVLAILNKGILLVFNILIDLGVVALMLAVSEINNATDFLKLITSFSVSIFTIFRVLHYFKDRRKKNNEANKTE